MTSSTGEIKILPSPIRPVRAEFTIASTARSTTLSSQTTSSFTFGEKIDDILGAAIKFGMALLPAEALGFDDGNTLQPNFVQRFFHFIEFERLDDSFNFFHVASSPVWPGLPIMFRLPV